MNNTTNGRKVNEETFHEIIEANPRMIPFFEGKEFLAHEFRVGKKRIDFVLRDSTYHYLVEMKYQQNPIAAIIDLDKKAPLFAEQEGLRVEQIKEVILIDRQSYKEQELKYHKDKGLICLTYDSAELLNKKGLSLKEQTLESYEMYFLKPLKNIQEEISQIESGRVYLGPRRRYSSLKTYLNFLNSHLKNLGDIMSVLARQMTGQISSGDIPGIKQNFSPVILTLKEFVREYKTVARCEPFEGFGNSYLCFLDIIAFTVDELVNQAVQLKQKMQDGRFVDFTFTLTGGGSHHFTIIFEAEQKEYIRKTQQ